MPTFIAESAADAIAQIREQMGPEAVVLSVRQLPATGLGRLWQKPRIEVVASLPEKPEPAPDPLAEIKSQLAELRQQLESRELKPTISEPAPGILNSSTRLASAYTAAATPPLQPLPSSPPPPSRPRSEPERHPSEAPAFPSKSGGISQVLENIGILPLYAQQLLEQLRFSYGDQPPKTMVQEVELACAALKRLWRTSTVPAANVHVFIGPAGVGKTTCLCKWLAQSILIENRLARVWRLDGAGPNAAESLSVYAEILGVPVERFIPEEGEGEGESNPAELLFIDLPGVNWRDARAVEALATQMKEFPAGHVHLVLNAAYETTLLLQQARAFASFPVTDLILTHLDEEGRWGKLWNLVLGTNYSIGWMSAGQNIPGEFRAATAQMLFERQVTRR